MKLLLHICCGPCATSSVSAWREKGAEVTGFFFNPNIHPFLEFRRRLTGARDLAGMVGLPLEEDLAYDPRSWFMQVGTAGDGRCRRCITMRLERTAQVARDKGFAAFATTLAISPWQDHSAIMQAGEEAACQHGVAFVYEDMRGLYPESRRLSREMGLYRQKYCGCLLSEWERYRDES